MPHLPASDEGLNDRFEATHWSLILTAGKSGEAPREAQAALARLCQTYWPPLYGFIRSRGYSLHDAQDLTQGFFCRLIEHELYTHADRAKGKFRSFLLTSVKNFLNDAYDREHALKRGGECKFLPLHEEQAIAAETAFQASTVPGLAPAEDDLFERQWAQTLVGAAFARLQSEFAREGKGSLFGTLKVFLHGSADPLPTYEQLARQLAMPAVTVRSHVNRLRARYRETLRAEIRQTVDSEEAVDEELRELLRVLTAH